MSQPFRPADTAMFRSLWQAQAGKCALCGEAMPAHRFETPHARVWAKRRPTLDHIRPRAKGGTDAPENIQLAHAACNTAKGSDWAG